MADYPRPTNGNGQAAANNSNGFGQGAGNATNNWGYIHPLSPPHPATDLVGLNLTEGYSLFISGNDTEPLNTANELNGTSGGGSLLEFNDLTGIDISSTIGTGALTKSGNNLEFTTTGTIRKIVLDNGVTFITGEGKDNILHSTDGTMYCELTGVTFTQGVNTPISDGTQTALQGFNRYTNLLRDSETFQSWGVLGGATVIDNNVNNPNGDLTAGTLTFGAGTSSSIFQAASPYTVDRRVSIWAKSSTSKKFRIRVDGSSPIFSDDFITTSDWQRFDLYVSGLNNPSNIYIINESAGGVGVIDIWGTHYINEDNPSEYIKTIDAGVENVIIPADVNDLDNDIFGNEILAPAVTDGYNFTGQSHFLNTSIVDSTGAGTYGQWIRPMSDEGNETFVSDDVLSITSDANRLLEVTFNGVTLTSTQTLYHGNWYFVKFGQDGAGIGEIWVGEIDETPTSKGTGAVGLPVAATTALQFGNYFGQFSQGMYHPFLETLDEVVNDYNATKSKVSLPTFSEFNFILAGQSNAISTTFATDPDRPSDLPADGVIPNAYYSDVNLDTQPYDLSMNIDNGLVQGFGVEYRLAKHMTDKGVDVNLLKHGKGGNAVTGGCWEVDATCTESLIRKVVRSGKRFEYFVWIQGESDSINSTLATQYFINAQATFDRIRKDTGQNIKLVLIRLSQPPAFTPSLPEMATVNTAMIDISDKMSNAVFVDVSEMDNATEIKSEQHYNNVGIDRIAETIISTLGI